MSNNRTTSLGVAHSPQKAAELWEGGRPSRLRRRALRWPASPAPSMLPCRRYPDFVYAFDRQRRFAYANPAMLALFGLSADEMLAKTFADFDYPAELAERLSG